MRTKQEVINFLESKVGTKVVCVGNSSLSGQCVTLIKSLMDFLGVPDPYKARGHAKTCISAYLNEGIAKPGLGFVSVFSNKDMGSGYGHIWCNAGDGDGTFYESNGQKPLIVTKGKTYSYDMVCNFDQYINLTESENTQEKYTEEEMTKVRLERDSNWTKYQEEIAKNKELQSVLDGVTRSRDDLKKEKQNFIDKVAAIIMSTADENNIIETVQRLISQESLLQAQIKQMEVESAKKQAELEKENKDLKDELERLQGEFLEMEKKHQAEIEVFKKRLENVQTQFEDNQEEVIKIDSWKTFVDAIIKIFKKG